MRLPHLTRNRHMAIIAAFRITVLNGLSGTRHHSNRSAKAPSRKNRNGSSMRGGPLPGIRPTVGSRAVCVTRVRWWLVRLAVAGGIAHFYQFYFACCKNTNTKHIPPTSTPQHRRISPPNHRPITTPHHRRISHRTTDPYPHQTISLRPISAPHQTNIHTTPQTDIDTTPQTDIHTPHHR